MDDDGYEPPERKEPWWYLTRQNRSAKLNAALAIGVGVYVIGFEFEPIYNAFTARRFIFFIVVIAFGIFGSVAAVEWVGKRRGGTAGPWATLAAVFMVFVIGHAAGDSTTQRHSNCWRVSGSDSSEIVACAPGSAPITGSSFDQDAGTGSARDCEYLRTGDGDVSIYHCSTSNI